MKSVYSFNAPQYKIAPAYVPLAAPNEKLIQAGIGAGGTSKGSRGFTAYYGMANQANRMMGEVRGKIKENMRKYDNIEDYQKSEDFKEDTELYHRAITEMGKMEAATKTYEEAYKKFTPEQRAATAMRNGYAVNEFGQRLSDKEFNEGQTLQVAQLQMRQQGNPIEYYDEEGRAHSTVFIPDAANTDARLGDVINKALQSVGYDRLKNLTLKNKDGEDVPFSNIATQEELRQLGTGGIVSILTQNGFEIKENYDQVRQAMEQAVGDLNRTEMSQHFLDQKRQGLVYSLPKIEKDKNGKPVYDENGNVKYVTKKNKEGKEVYDMEERAIMSQNDFKHWANQIIVNGVSKKTIDEQIQNRISTNVIKPNKGGPNGNEPEEIDLYGAASTGAFREIFESSTELGGVTESVNKILTVSGLDEEQRTALVNKLNTEVKNGLKTTLEGEFKGEYTFDDLSENFGNPSKMKDILTDKGYKKLLESYNTNFRESLKGFVERGYIEEGTARQAILSVYGNKKSGFNPKEWKKKASEGYKGWSMVEGGYRDNDITYVNKNDGRVMTGEEYKSMLAREALEEPLAHVETPVLMRNEIGVQKHNQRLFSDTKFQYTNLRDLGTNLRYLGQNINSQSFRHPAYAVESSRFYTGLRSDGDISLGTTLLVHEDDLKNLKGHIPGHKGENIPFSAEENSEELKVTKLSKDPYNLAANQIFKNMGDNANAEDWYIVPGVIMDHNPYKEESVRRDGFTAPVSKKNEVVFLNEE